jgi:hypothetical protein
VRRLLAQIDQDCRVAAQAAAAAGLSERIVATLVGVKQPTVHGWLDERHSAPLPPPSLASEIWNLHTVAAALRSLIVRIGGRHLPESPPTPHHVRPADAARKATDGINAATEALGQLGAAIEYADGPGT